MRAHPIAAALLCAFGSFAAQAAVIVTHGDPDGFTDAGDRSTDPVKVMKTLKTHLERLGERYLPPGTDVRIEVIDLDRAGRTRMNMPMEMRVINGKTDMPCMDVSYTVVTNGSASPAVRERVCDPDFLRQLPPRESANDPLVYEKRMLDDWFRARFGASAKPR